MRRVLILGVILLPVFVAAGCNLNLGSLGGVTTSLAGSTTLDLHSSAPVGTTNHTVTASGSGLNYNVTIIPTTASDAGALTLATAGKARSMVSSDGTSIRVQISNGPEDVGHFRPFGSSGATVDIAEGTVLLEYFVDHAAGTSRLDHVSVTLTGKAPAGTTPATYEASWTR
jgi:hypothetical protein